MMADTSTSNRHLQDIRAKSESLNSRPEAIKEIVDKTSLGLFELLGDNTLSVDDGVVDHLNDIHANIGTLRGPVGTVGSIQDRRNALAVTLGGMSAGDPRRTSTQAQIDVLDDTIPHIAGRMVTRETEYNQLHTYANYFNRGNPIPEQTITLGGAGNVTLNPIFIPGAVAQCDYHLCDRDGKRLSQRGVNYVVQLPMEGGGAQEVEISGITLRPAPHNDLDITNLRFNPPNIDMEQPLRLSVDGAYNNVGGTGINVVHNKNIDINVTSGVRVDSEVRRRASIRSIDNAGPGHNIRDALFVEYGNHREEIVRNQLMDSISTGNPDFASLNDPQKDILWKEIKNIGGGNLLINILGGATRNPAEANGTIRPVGAGNLRDDFSTYLASDDRDWPENIVRSRDVFETHLVNNMPALIKDFFKHCIETYLNTNSNVERNIKTAYTRLKTEIDEGTIDSHVDQDVDGAITDNINRPKFRRDKNYMRFFAGKQHSVSAQSVNLVDSGRKQTTNYSLDTCIDSAKKISANIELGDQSISLQHGSPANLIKSILSCNLIDQGKVRCHIAYNVIKSLIHLAKENHISLTYYDKRRKITSQIVQQGDKIVSQTIDDTGVRRNTTVLFDENLFDATKNHAKAGVRSLRTGLERLTSEFDKAMNQTHRQYRDATERRLLGLRKGHMKTNLPTSFFLSPLRYISNWGKNMNCDFEDQTVTVGDKSATVSFKKGKFTLNTEGLKKPITSRNLGRLLNKRKNKRRIFEGMEREICEAVYKQLIENLRKNPKVQRKNFGVKDRMTNRIYVLDYTGKWAYIPPEQTKKGRERRFSSGRIRDGRMGARVGLKNPQEQELYKNPLLMGRMIKAMAKGML